MLHFITSLFSCHYVRFVSKGRDLFDKMCNDLLSAGFLVVSRFMEIFKYYHRAYVDMKYIYMVMLPCLMKVWRM